jgi:hypothetical protein
MPGYTIWMTGQTQVGGLMALPPEAAGTPPHWLVYVGTPSVDATAEHAQRLGARVVKPASDIPNVGRFAVLADPQGATFALYTPGAGSAGASSVPSGVAGEFSWHELATTDVAGALRFYGELFGWTKGPGHDMGAMGTYQLFERFGVQVGGMCNVQGPSTPPSWLSYVRVADSTRAAGAAKAAGGRLLHGPVEVPGGSWIAMLLDPQGGAFAVHEMPRAQARPAAAPKAAMPAAQPKPAAPPAAKPPASPAPAGAPRPAAPARLAAAVSPVAAAKPAAPKKKAAKKKAAKKPARRKAAKAKPARRKKRRAVRKAAPKRRAVSARKARRGK